MAVLAELVLNHWVAEKDALAALALAVPLNGRPWKRPLRLRLGAHPCQIATRQLPFSCAKRAAHLAQLIALAKHLVLRAMSYAIWSCGSL